MRLAHFRRAPVVFIFALAQLVAQTPGKWTINLRKALGSQYACAVYRPIQFLSEDEILLLAGPTDNCYRSVSQLQLVVLSVTGHVTARRDWPSTYPGVVLSHKRLAVAAWDQLLVLDDRLTTTQTISLPKHRAFPILSSDEQGLSVVTDAGLLLCTGMPLKCEERRSDREAKSGEQTIYRFADGRGLTREGELLMKSNGESPSQRVADLSWVVPRCERYVNCQAYDAGTTFQVVSGTKRRVLVASNGSKFPVTDAAGLFPYFRLQVFDLDTGSEIYREQDVLRTGRRGAALSPEGDLLAAFDGATVVMRRLK